MWGRNRYLAIIPVMLLCADIGMDIRPYISLRRLTPSGLGVYAVWLLAQTEPGKNALLGLVTERVKYFYVITLVLNLLCTGEAQCFSLVTHSTQSRQFLSHTRSGESTQKSGDLRGRLVCSNPTPAVSYWSSWSQVRAPTREQTSWKLSLLSAAIYSALLVILIATSATSTPVMLGMLDIVRSSVGRYDYLVSYPRRVDISGYRRSLVSGHISVY